MVWELKCYDIFAATISETKWFGKKLKGMLSYIQATHSQEMENRRDVVRGSVSSSVQRPQEPGDREGRQGRPSAQGSSLLEER